MKIGLLDHMGYGNLGDAATQDALIAGIRRRMPNVELVGFSLNPTDTGDRHGIISYSITHWHPGLATPTSQGAEKTSLWTRLQSCLKHIPIFSRLVRASLNLAREVVHWERSFKVVRTLDTLIVAGGGQLGELWRGPWSHPYNIFKFSLLTKLANKKLVILNVGAGPLKTRAGKFFVKLSVSFADYVSLRDDHSQALIQQLDVKQKLEVFPDSAYALDVAQYNTGKPEKEGDFVVGINPIGYGDPRIWPLHDNAIYTRYLDQLSDFILFLARNNYRVQVYSGEASVDRYALADLKTRLLNSGQTIELDNMFLLPSTEVKDVLNTISQFDFVVTSKFHGVIFSHLLEKPVIALSYHNKIDDLMRDVGHSEYCLGIDNFDNSNLCDTFLRLVENADFLRSLFSQTSNRNSAMLKSQFDDLFVQDNLQRHVYSLDTEAAV